jgi:hypothetical protein
VLEKRKEKRREVERGEAGGSEKKPEHTGVPSVVANAEQAAGAARDTRIVGAVWYNYTNAARCTNLPVSRIDDKLAVSTQNPHRTSSMAVTRSSPRHAAIAFPHREAPSGV